MSEILKVTYRGFGGFIVLTIIFALAVTSLALLVTGVGGIALAIYILFNPDMLQTVTVTFINTRVTDTWTAFVLIFMAGILIILMGSACLALTNGVWNYSLKLDKGLSRYFDESVPRTGELVDRMKKPAQPADKISKLERLARLREQGVLTETEFAQEKQLILKEKDN